MLTVSKSKLKARMLEYFRRVEETGEEITVVSRNVPVIRICRVDHARTVEKVFEDVRGRVRITDRVMKPETAEWGEV
jgi:prevent-host-death family protein